MDRSRTLYRILLLLVVLWCAGIVVAPLARTAGFPSAVPTSIYGVFSHVCHQFADRSFSLGGEPLAVCVRCTAIYFGFLLTLLVFPLVRSLDNEAVPPRWVLLAAVSPMALDVALNILGLHASSVLTRVLSGSLAGLVLPCYVVPPLLEGVNKLLSPGESFNARQAQ